MRHNRFAHNRGVPCLSDILFQEAENCVAEDDVFVDNAVGIFMESLRGTVFRRNLIAANDTALRIFSSATGNTFEANNFIDNLSPVEVIGRSTHTRWSGPQSGNYWSEYEGYDLNADGVGRRAVQNPEYLQRLEEDCHAHTHIYLYSPASQALAAAENAFPVFEGSREFDRRPHEARGAGDPTPEKPRKTGIYPLAIFVNVPMLLIPAVVLQERKKSDECRGGPEP